MDRYTRLFERLSSMPAQNLRLCPSKGALCACNGCAGEVGSKWVTKQELDFYLSGELKMYLDKQKDKNGKIHQQ